MREQVREINKRLRQLTKLINKWNEDMMVMYESGATKLPYSKKLKDNGEKLYTEYHYLIDLKDKFIN